MEARKSDLIDKALAGLTPECVYVRPFWNSVRFAGSYLYAHAVYVENGRKFYWSFSNLGFYAGSDRLSLEAQQSPSRLSKTVQPHDVALRPRVARRRNTKDMAVVHCQSSRPNARLTFFGV